MKNPKLHFIKWFPGCNVLSIGDRRIEFKCRVLTAFWRKNRIIALLGRDDAADRSHPVSNLVALDAQGCELWRCEFPDPLGRFDEIRRILPSSRLPFANLKVQTSRYHWLKFDVMTGKAIGTPGPFRYFGEPFKTNDWLWIERLLLIKRPKLKIRDECLFVNDEQLALPRRVVRAFWKGERIIVLYDDHDPPDPYRPFSNLVAIDSKGSELWKCGFPDSEIDYDSIQKILSGSRLSFTQLRVKTSCHYCRTVDVETGKLIGDPGAQRVWD